MLPLRDAELLHILDQSLDDATQRAQQPDGSSWLSCRPGCTPCCHGVFRISALDAERLRVALATLAAADPERAAAIAARAADLREALGPSFPGDLGTGVLPPEDDPAWDAFADLPETDAACPVLDPASGRCELYAGRPLTCRVFGPPVRNEGGLGTCELCYVGASDAAIFAGEMHLRHQALEEELEATLPPGDTVIAWALQGPRDLAQAAPGSVPSR